MPMNSAQPVALVERAGQKAPPVISFTLILVVLLAGCIRARAAHELAELPRWLHHALFGHRCERR